MTLTDQHPGVVNGLSQTQLEHQGLKPPLQEVLWCQSQNVIELVLVVIQKAVLIHTPEQGLTLKHTPLRTLHNADVMLVLLVVAMLMLMPVLPC